MQSLHPNSAELVEFNHCLNQEEKKDEHWNKRSVQKEESKPNFSPLVFCFMQELLECTWNTGFALGMYLWVLALPFVFPLAVLKNSIQKTLVNSRKLLLISPYSQRLSLICTSPPNKMSRWLNLKSSSQFYSWLSKRPWYASLLLPLLVKYSKLIWWPDGTKSWGVL